jgi:hypothetical protein
VAGGEQNTAGGTTNADEVAGSGSGHDAVVADEELLHAVCGTNLCNDLSDLRVVVTAITTDNEGCALGAFGDGVEDGGHKVLGVVGLLEDLDLLTKTGAVGETCQQIVWLIDWEVKEVSDLRSGLLVLERLGLDCLDAHDCNGMCVCLGGVRRVKKSEDVGCRRCWKARLLPWADQQRVAAKVSPRWGSQRLRRGFSVGLTPKPHQLSSAKLELLRHRYLMSRISFNYHHYNEARAKELAEIRMFSPVNQVMVR